MNRDSLLEKVTVIDTETTDLRPDNAEIVEIAGARYRNGTWHVDSTLLGATRGIPPEASAKNHISPRMIQGLPTFSQSIPRVMEVLDWPGSAMWVAHNSPYDQRVLSVAWAGCGAAHQHNSLLAEDRAIWICTHRLAKKLLDLAFSDMQYNLSYLRYKLDLPVDDDLGSHRASVDTLVCANLFEFLVDFALATEMITEGPDMLNQLHALCWDPVLVSAWPFGKHKGQPLADVPTDYYLWAIDNLDSLKEGSAGFDGDLAASVAAELARRL